MNINVARFPKLLEDAGEFEKLAAFKKAIEAAGSDKIEQSYLALMLAAGTSLRPSCRS